MEITTEHLSRAIVLVRTEQQKSRRDLAVESDISYPYMADIETAKRNPSLKTLRAICRALGISLSQLYDLAERMQKGSVLFQQ